MRSGPVVIGYDGSAASDRAVHEAADLLSERKALVVVVYKAGVAFEALELPTVTGLPPAPVDIRTALEVDEAIYERAQRLAQHGAGLAREAGFDAEGIVVAEEFDVSIAATIVRVARERDAQAVVVGAHHRGRLDELLLGSTSRGVVRNAPCPVLVVRAEGEKKAAA
jgi:nucleotide-binding universal stress UspA family protein